MKPVAKDRELLDTVQEGLRRLGLTFPYLVGLIQKIEVVLDRRVATTGIFASGRLLVNPDFVRALSPRDLLFVLAHELYHLTLRSHERSEGTDPLAFNHAHDYIINDLLREELQLDTIPAGGPDWPGARVLSAERLLGEMQRNPSLRPSASWDQLLGGGSGEGADEDGEGEGAEGQAGEGQGRGRGPAGDVLDRALEREWFPDTTAQAQEARARAVQEQAARAASLQALMASMSGRGKGTDPGAGQDSVAALRGWYRPPWELALQRWLESVAPSDRSYARPSRRGADRRDVVLPGRKREGWTLHIVLDTSGSMVDEVPRALGVIADFCEAVGVEQVHLIQCDTAVGSDEVLAPAEVARWQVTGFGGSDLTPAMLRLAEDPEVSAAVVLTDGEIDYPEQPVPYGVLWVLPAWKDPRDFTPRYGKVIGMTHS
jgi:predicted metal-dependent peptidase